MTRDYYTQLCAALVFPLHEWAKGHDTARVRRELEKTQWWGPDEIGRLRIARLKALLADAAATVPYYRNLFSSIGFNPRDLRSEADLASLPLLTKDAIR